MDKITKAQYMHKYHKNLTEEQIKKYNKYKKLYEKRRKNDPELSRQTRERQKLNRRKVRLICLVHYGGNPPKCNCCGESYIEFLGIDHINGGGGKHRKSIKVLIYSWLKSNNFPTGFRVLCHNCNMAKSFYGQCPHDKEKTKRR